MATSTTPTISEDFREFLLGDVAVSALVGQRIHQYHVPGEAQSIYPRVWFRKSQHTDEPELDGTTGGLLQTTFDVELLATDPDELDQLTDAVRARLNGYPAVSGATFFGSRNVRGVFAEDHDEDYIPFLVGGDEGTLVASLSALVIYAPYGE